MVDERKLAIEFVNDQIKVQKLISKIYDDLQPKVTNKLISEAVEWMALRARSHAVMFKALLTLVQEEEGQFISEEMRDELTQTFKETTKYQGALIKALKEFLPKIQKERVANTLKWMLTDMRREDTLINRFTKIGLQEETLTNDALWKLLWKEPPEG